MRTTIRIAALLLGGIALVGCNKDSTTTPPPTVPSTATPTPPGAPDTSKVGSTIDNAVNKGADATKTEANKLLNQAPTTAPSIPGLGK